MRAKFIFEKFVEDDSDPITDMGIGISQRIIKTKAFKILQFIASKGQEGASLTEIQYFIWTEIRKFSEKDFWKKTQTWDYDSHTRRYTREKFIRASRGFYTTALYGGWHYPGLLHKYCKKNEKGKWVLVRWPKGNENIYDRN